MNYQFFTDIQDRLIEFGSVVVNLLSVKVADVLPPGADTFLSADIMSLDLLGFLLNGGIVAIIAWNLAKWLVPFLD